MKDKAAGAARIEARGPGHYMLCGELSFATVPDLLEQGTGVLRGSTGPVTMDLGEVTRSDSAGLALLVAWVRAARGAGVPLSFHNVTPQLRAIAQVSGVDVLLGMAH